MVLPGETFLIKSPPDFKTEHLFIVIAIKKDKALLVNITSNDSDQTCILTKGEHPFLKHSSYINYKDALLADINLIKESIKKKVINTHTDVPPLILKKIKDGTANSPNFNPEYLSYL